MAGNSEFLSSCNGYLGEPLQLFKGSQASFQLLRGKTGVALEVLQGKWASSHIEGVNIVVFLE